MKRKAMAWLKANAESPSWDAPYARDILDSDAALRAEVKRLRAEKQAGLDRETRVRGEWFAMSKERDAMLNMLEHIEWHNGTCPAKSRDALKALVGLPLKPLKKGTR